MGNSGRKILNETLQEWDLDYEEKKFNKQRLVYVKYQKIEKKFHINFI